MDISYLTVKDILSDPEAHEIIKKEVPELLMVPMFVIGGKTCGEVFEHIVSKKLASKSDADRVLALLEAALEKTTAE